MDSFAELTRYTAAMGATPMAVKKILVLTTTYVSFGCLALLRQHDITIAAPTEELAWWLTHGLDEACGIALSVSQTTELDRVMAEHDLVVTNVPDDELPHVISSAIRGRTDVVATNGVSRAAWDLQEVAEQAGIVLFLEASVAHGVRRLYGMQSRFVIDSSAGGRVRYVTCEPYTPSRRRRPHGQRPNFIRHDLIVDWPDQRPQTRFTATSYVPEGERGFPGRMGRLGADESAVDSLVGVPCGLAAQLVLARRHPAVTAYDILTPCTPGLFHLFYGMLGCTGFVGPIVHVWVAEREDDEE